MILHKAARRAGDDPTHMAPATLTVRIVPGTHGVAFLKRNVKDDKPLRRALAAVVMHLLDDAAARRGEAGLWMATFADMEAVHEFLVRDAGAEVGWVSPLPEGIDAPDFGETFMVGVSLGNVALVASFHADRDAFMTS